MKEPLRRSIVASLEALAALQHPLTRRLWWLFGAYITVIFVFAAVYYDLYSAQPNAFAFSSDVVRAQQASKIDDLAHAARIARARLGRLQQVAQDLSVTDSSFFIAATLRRGPEIITGRNRMRFGLKVMCVVENEPCYSVVELAFADRSGAILDQYSAADVDRLVLPSTAAEARSLVGAMIVALRGQAIRAEAAMTATRDGTVQIWTFPDFVYFSSITQMTVGYGDIIPNSTRVRMVVMLQLAVSVVMLVVVLNVILANPQIRKSPDDAKDS